MKRLFSIFAIVFLSAMAAGAQDTTSELRYKELFTRQVERVGYTGLGVEGILSKWETDYPGSGEMLRSKFSHKLAKSMRTEVVSKDQSRFMGEKPLFELHDSTGRPVFYFQENFFDDALFGEAVSVVDKAIELHPTELSYRAEKISALMAYEKENPSKSVAEVQEIIRIYKKDRNGWLNFHEAVDDEMFQLIIQDFCFNYYHIGSAASYEAFLDIATRMNKLFPKSEIYLGDLGTYWLVAREDTKKSRKYYEKLLKLNPESELALKNLSVIERIEAKTAAGK